MDPFIGEIRAFGFNFTPRDWAPCSGQLLQVSQHSALYSLLGTIYGGDGRSSFGVPDLRGRTIVGQGVGPGLTTKVIGRIGGYEQVQLTESQIPSHNHSPTLNSYADTGTTDSPAGALLGKPESGEKIYISGGRTLAPMEPDAITSNTIGGSSTHSNMQPYLVLNYCIALQGVFPSRS